MIDIAVGFILGFVGSVVASATDAPAEVAYLAGFVVGAAGAFVCMAVHDCEEFKP